MAGIKVRSDGAGEFLLEGDLDRYTVMQAWQDRASQLAAMKGQRAIVDLAGIEHVDTAGLAWLVNLAAECKALGQALVLRNLPDSVSKLAKISDVDALLPLQ